MSIYTTQSNVQRWRFKYLHKPYYGYIAHNLGKMMNLHGENSQEGILERFFFLGILQETSAPKIWEEAI